MNEEVAYKRLYEEALKRLAVVQEELAGYKFAIKKLRAYVVAHDDCGCVSCNAMMVFCDQVDKEGK
jgi:hypothetical protein